MTRLHLLQATTQEVVGLHRPATLRVVTCAASVADKSAPAAATNVLKAMGKSEQVTGMRERLTEGAQTLPSWLTAYNTELLVISRAHTWNKRTYTDFIRLTDNLNLNIVFACEPGTLNQMRQRLGHHPATDINLHGLSALLPPEDETENVASDPERFEVPADDWGTFRHTARQTLTPDQFERIDTAYITGAKAGTTAPHTHDGVHNMLVQILCTQEDAATATAAMRGAQAALFKQGWSLRLDPQKVISLYAHNRPVNYTHRDWLALRAYRDPERSATATLHGYGLNTTDIPTFTITDCATTLTTGLLNGQKLNTHARAYLTAAHHWRNTNPNEPLCTGDPGRIIVTAGKDTGILIANKPIHTSPHTKAIWTAGHGYLLKEIPT